MYIPTYNTQCRHRCTRRGRCLNAEVWPAAGWRQVELARSQCPSSPLRPELWSIWSILIIREILTFGVLDFRTNPYTLYIYISIYLYAHGVVTAVTVVQACGLTNAHFIGTSSLHSAAGCLRLQGLGRSWEILGHGTSGGWCTIRFQLSSGLASEVENGPVIPESPSLSKKTRT